MSSYLITSREGLYHFEAFNKEFTLLKEGYFFGLAQYKGVWYIFGFDGESEHERTLPTFNGYIASFRIDYTCIAQYPAIVEWKVLHNGLDNGTHQIKIFKNKLYVLETYIQTIKIFDISDDNSITLSKSIGIFSRNKPVANAHYILQGYGDAQCTCNGYKHINALTIQDNLIYLSCPSLRNAINTDGKPCQAPSPHVIEVYDLSLNFLWSFVIHSEIFCHDIVFHGHKFYFGAPPNKLCSFNIVTKQYEVHKTFDINSMHPRGLSIDNYGTVLTGLRKPNLVVISNINNLGDVDYVNAPCSPCFIAKLDYENDFNNCMSLLVRPFVYQLSCASLPICTKEINTIAACVFSNEWRKYIDKRQYNKNILVSEKTNTIHDILTPDIKCFDNINNLQAICSPKIHMFELVVEDDMKDAYMDTLTTFNMFEQNVRKRALLVTGKMYLYPPGSGMGWHTNLEDNRNMDTIRCYLVHTTTDNQSFFLYKHPFSKLIHAVPDRDAHSNIFDLGSPKSPLWHAVYNNSQNTQRLSVGIAFHKYRMGAFHALKEIVEDISH